jgi:chromosome segregation and condensation protein ScpB
MKGKMNILKRILNSFCKEPEIILSQEETEIFLKIYLQQPLAKSDLFEGRQLRDSVKNLLKNQLVENCDERLLKPTQKGIVKMIHSYVSQLRLDAQESKY